MQYINCINDVLTHLDEKQKQIFAENTSTICFKKGDLIYKSTQDCMGLTMVISGEIRAFITSQDGHEINLFKITKNDCCALSSKCSLNAIAIEVQFHASKNCTLQILKPNALRYLIDNNIYFKCFCYELISKRVNSIMQVIERYVFTSVDKRLCLLFIEYEKNHHSKIITITHQEIANEILSAREVVSRELKKLANLNLIKTKRNLIEIVDLIALESYCKEDK